MSEAIKRPANFWTAGAVEAWRKGTCRSRLRPDGVLEQSIDGGNWHVSEFATVEHLELNGVAEVHVLPIPDWARGYDRAAESPCRKFRVCERGGDCTLWDNDHRSRTPEGTSVENFVQNLGYEPRATVLGGWPEHVTGQVAAEGEWTHEYADDGDFSYSQWRYKPDGEGGYIAEGRGRRVHAGKWCRIENRYWSTPDRLKECAANSPDDYPGFRVVREPAPTGAPRPEPASGGPAPDRPWQAGDVVRRPAGSPWYLFALNGKEWIALGPDYTQGCFAKIDDLGAYRNLGPHRIEPDGQGGLRFVKIDAPPQPDPERLTADQYVTLLAALMARFPRRGADESWGDYVASLVKIGADVEPAIVAALRGRP